MKNKIKIACLPVAGNENPYQKLMIKGLNTSNRIDAFNGVDDRFLGVLRTYLKFKPNYIHFDWIQSYYIRKYFWLTILMLPFFLFQVLYIKLLTKTKLVWTLHNIFPHDTMHIKFHKYIRSFFAKNCKWIRVFSSSTISRVEQYLNLPQNHIIVCPEGDYTSIYKNNITSKQAREVLNIGNNELVFLFLGFIKPYKGIEDLIEIFSLAKIKNSRLIIAGQGIDSNYTKKIKDKSSNYENIEVHDRFIEVEELQNYYNASDVVVLPFQKIENSGSVIMAMGFKKIILAPSIGVITDRLKNQKDFLYKDLREKLNTTFAKYSKEELVKIGEKNYQSLQEFKWSDFSKAFK